MNNIVCFGASLTAQVGLNGYIGQLKKMGMKVSVAGYGGYQMEHAHLITEDLKILNPNIVIVEWFSPSKTYSYENIELYLGTLLNNILNLNSKVLCIMLPNLNSQPHIKYFELLKIYFLKYSIPFIDLLSEVNLDLACDLKSDKLHTLEGGAKKYANTIYNYLNNFVQETQILKIPIKNHAFLKVRCFEENIIANIGEYIEILSVYNIKPNCTNINKELEILGVSFLIGPQSGWIEKNNNCKLNLWDKWCGKNRVAIKFNFFTPCILKPLDIDFNRNESLLQPQWGPTKIEILKIYYIGDDNFSLQAKVKKIN